MTVQTMSAPIGTPIKAAARQRSASTPVATNILQRKCACGGSAGIAGKCAECSKKRIQGDVKQKAPSHELTHQVVDITNSTGSPLDTSTKRFMESSFGHDFSRVRIHTDDKAARSVEALDAVAYTIGHHIVFGKGRYMPETGEGKKLVAHELVHILQQQGSMRPVEGKPKISDPSGTEEKEAEKAFNLLTEGNPITTMQGVSYKIARQVSQPAPPSSPTELREQIIRDWIRKNGDEVRELLTPLIDILQDEASRKQPHHLWPFEERSEKGVIFETFPEEESVEERSFRLEELADDLLSMSIKLRHEPVPPAWLGAETYGGSHGGDIGPTAVGAASRFYSHYAEEAGRDLFTMAKNLFYIEDFRSAPEAEEEAECNPRPTGIDILVEDPKTKPDDYTYPVSLTTWEEEGGPQRVKTVYKDVCGVGSIAGLPFFYYRFEEEGERWYLNAETKEDVKAMGTPGWHTELHAPPGKPLPTR